MSRENGRRDVDELLAIALAAGATLKDAAEDVGISVSTAKRRAADPAFSERVDGRRAELAKALRDRVVHTGTRALDTLGSLLDSESESIRLGAARALLGAAVPKDHASIARFTSKDISGIGLLFYETLVRFIPEEQQARAAAALDAALAAKIGA